MNQATQDFTRQHQDDDVRQLRFLGSEYSGSRYAFRSKKIRFAGERWLRVEFALVRASLEGIILTPPHISMEQCSFSESTALYKAERRQRDCFGFPSYLHLEPILRLK